MRLTTGKKVRVNAELRTLKRGTYNRWLQQIGQFLRSVPFARHEARIIIHALDKFPIVQPKQDRIDPVDDLSHEITHVIIADTRKVIPRYLAIWRNDLHIQ